jgi:hypothetical protein
MLPTVNKVEEGEGFGYRCAVQCALCNACMCVFSAANALCLWAQPYKSSLEIVNRIDLLSVSLLYSLCSTIHFAEGIMILLNFL